ncbi:MAG: hypothetical protein EZS28_052897 [Streblomastix strix]|uniref:Uncharacterized protein n=1 Tax=Streblomastix strix TaxID=222440 RepID=A0A5J4RR29_9EUKA|nr:MAG: hypothetical protein EZS28_052897 [Streblomastix strix]
MQYGRFFLDWYSGLLIEHGKKILKEAVKIFRINADSKAFIGGHQARVMQQKQQLDIMLGLRTKKVDIQR